MTYRSTVSEVRLLFFATDENRRPVPDLQGNDFAVVDDERVIRDFRSFAPITSTKVDLMILLDNSESVGARFHEEIKVVEELLPRSTSNSNDNFSVLSFSGMETHFICASDCGEALARDKLNSITPRGSTPLFDALKLAASVLIQHRQTDVLPVILLFSDGEDTISRASFDEAVQKILASGALIYAIDFADPGGPSNGSAILRTLADDSGGRTISLESGAEGISSQIDADFRAAYVVTYASPATSSEFHSVGVFPTRNLNLRLRSRCGYYHSHAP